MKSPTELCGLNPIPTFILKELLSTLSNVDDDDVVRTPRAALEFNNAVVKASVEGLGWCVIRLYWNVTNHKHTSTHRHTMLIWFDSFYVRVSTIPAI